MNEELLINLGRDAIFTALQVAGPLLGVGLLAGLTISVFQAVTQIQEATLSFIPKIVGVALAFLFFMPWMMNKLVKFTNFLFSDWQMFIH